VAGWNIKYRAGANQPIGQQREYALHGRRMQRLCFDALTVLCRHGVARIKGAAYIKYSTGAAYMNGAARKRLAASEREVLQVEL